MRKSLVAACLLALVLAAPAAAASTPTPCWQRLLNDYYDNGRIDHTYRASCYSEAIRRIPRPIRDYSDAYDVLSRNLQSALRDKKQDDRDPIVPAPAAPPSDPPSTRGGPASPEIGPPPRAPFTRVAETTHDATTVPLPLLVLAGLGLLLTAAGGIGALARRRRG